MIEYLYNAVRATAGEDITISAKIIDTNVASNTSYHLNLYQGENSLGTYEGRYIGNVWEFIIPASATLGLKGRYFYCICDNNHTKLNFKQPLYLV